MKPSDVRQQILAEHERLRERLRELEGHAAAATAGDASAAGLLRARLAELFAAFRTHVEHEEALLVPALLAADAWGPQRAAQIRDEHVAQTLLLAGWERADDLPVADLAARLVDFAEHLRGDMAAEERDLLHPDVLRDDVVAVSQSSS